MWINGTFGVGKTTLAKQLVATDSTLRLFDPEWVGYMLTSNLRGIDIADFQDLAAWRLLVPTVARHVSEISGQQLVTVQTVLSEEYWNELTSGMTAQGIGVFHVLLDADDSTLRERIEGDSEELDAREWRLDRLDDYASARPWLSAAADLVIDTSSMTPSEVAAALKASVRAPS